MTSIGSCLKQDLLNCCSVKQRLIEKRRPPRWGRKWLFDTRDRQFGWRSGAVIGTEGHGAVIGTEGRGAVIGTEGRGAVIGTEGRGAMTLNLKRCCCFALRKGCIFIACFCGAKAVILLLVASYSAYEAHNNARKAETDDNRKLNVAIEVTSIVMAVFNGAEIVSNALLLKGIMDGKPKFMFLWMVLCIIGLIFSSFLFISAIALTIFIESDSEIIWTLLAEPINIGINIYFHLVVQSYYKQQKVITPNGPKQVSALSVVKTYPSQPATPLTQYLIEVPNLPPIHYPPKKKLPKMSDAPGTQHFGSMVSWIEGDCT